MSDDNKDDADIAELSKQVKDTLTDTIKINRTQTFKLMRLLLDDLTLADLAWNNRDTTTTMMEAKFCAKYKVDKIEHIKDDDVAAALLYLYETAKKKKHKLANRR